MLLEAWKNQGSQSSLIHSLLRNAEDVFSFSAFPCHKIVVPKDFINCPISTVLSDSALYANTWNSVELWDYIFSSTFSVEHIELFKCAIEKSPDFFCIYMSSLAKVLQSS